MEFILTSYQPTELSDFRSLFTEAFNRNYSVETYTWQFLQNPAGFLVSNAIDQDNENKLAGTSSGVILKAQLNGKRCTSCRIQNSMTANEYRGQGLFKLTADDLARQFFEQGGDFMVTYPTRDISMHTFYSLGFRCFPIHTWRMQVNDEMQNRSGILHTEIADFNQEDVALMGEFLSQYNISQTRDIDFLNWRYGQHSDKKYYILRLKEEDILKAVLIYKIYQKELDIVDVFYPAKEAKYFETLLDELQRFATVHHCENINIWSAAHYSFHNLIVNYGFKETEMITNISFKFNPELEDELLEHIDNYYFSYGDSDVY
jgi:hypothetical protein